MSNTDFENLRAHAQRGDYTNAHLARRVQELEKALDKAADEQEAAHRVIDSLVGLSRCADSHYRRDANGCVTCDDGRPPLSLADRTKWLITWMTDEPYPLGKRITELEEKLAKSNSVTFRILNECGLPGNANSGALYDRCQHIAAVLKAAQDDAARLRAALEAVEYDDFGYCPWCDAPQDSGHRPDCPRQAALAQTAHTEGK